MLLVALLFSALGIMIASLLRDMQGFQLIMNFLVMPLFFLSGALFPLTNLPVALMSVVRVDPLSYGVDALRHFLIGVSSFAIELDIAVLAGVTALLLWLSSIFFSRIQV
jgi:ABC-2 type transport system permease protein